MYVGRGEGINAFVYDKLKRFCMINCIMYLFSHIHYVTQLILLKLI